MPLALRTSAVTVLRPPLTQISSMSPGAHRARCRAARGGPRPPARAPWRTLRAVFESDLRSWHGADRSGVDRRGCALSRRRTRDDPRVVAHRPSGVCERWRGAGGRLGPRHGDRTWNGRSGHAGRHRRSPLVRRPGHVGAGRSLHHAATRRQRRQAPRRRQTGRTSSRTSWPPAACAEPPGAHVGALVCAAVRGRRVIRGSRKKGATAVFRHRATPRPRNSCRAPSITD